jgi:hypothetical protein
MHKVEVFVRAIDEAFGVRLLTVINGSRLDTEFEGPRAILFVSATDTYHTIIPLGAANRRHEKSVHHARQAAHRGVWTVKV